MDGKTKECEKNVKMCVYKVDFSEVLRSFRWDDRSFTKTVEKPPESPSTSGSINTAGNVISRDDLDST